jgi:hypothetical protein
LRPEVGREGADEGAEGEHVTAGREVGEDVAIEGRDVECFAVPENDMNVELQAA